MEAVNAWASVVDRIRCGDEAGVSDLYAAVTNGPCVHFLRSVDPQSAEDRLHELLVIVIEAIRGGRLREPDRVMGFVRTIARRQMVAEIRAATTRRRRFVASEVELRASLDQSPEAGAAQRETFETITKVMRRLSARDREILRRFYLDEQAPAQICGEMNLTSTQFRLYKSRAIARCRGLRPKALQSTRPL
jgi:RNA polymerase sigma-70 factor (ECF subfamily)